MDSGGQRTRLGFSNVIELFLIGPVSGGTIFDFLCGQWSALGKRYGMAIPNFVMTSDATNDELVQAFEQSDEFWLDPELVRYFPQGHTPAVAHKTGRLLPAGKILSH